MSYRSRLLTMGWTLGLLLALAIFAAAADTDLSWIARLPGLSSGVQTEKAGEVSIVYTYDGDVRDSIAALRSGLEEHGWRVEQKSGVAVAGISIADELRAYKSGASAHITTVGTTGAGGAHTIVITLRGGTTAPPAKSASRPPAVPAAPAAPAVSKAPAAPAAPRPPRTEGNRVVIWENEVVRTIACEETEVVVNGNECRLKLTGNCSELTVQGNENQITIRGPIRAINTPGNDNVVNWSAENNPKRPSISNLGSRNEINKIEE